MHRPISLHTLSRLPAATRGAAAAEFAIILPVLLAILLGMVVYGTYMWRAHGLQQVANDAARAALAGVTRAERKQLVDDLVAAEIPALAGVSATGVVASVAEAGNDLTVQIAYDASGDLLPTGGLVPLPNRTITRRAVIRLAGL